MSAALNTTKTGPTTKDHGPLAGIRIVDLTSVIFGPYATQNLGDMGADVVKIEAPEGDIARWLVPMKSPGMAGIFMNTNRNKRSVVLDLKQPAGRAALLKIVAGADVFVHNLRPQAIAKLKLTYADMTAVKPDLIYCNAWGFGRRGPYAERPAYDDVIQAMSGSAELSRLQTGNAPALAPTIMADKTSGMFLTNAILLGLVHRLRTGTGAGDRSADVREHGVLHHGRAPGGRGLPAAGEDQQRHHGLRSRAGAQPQAVAHGRRLHDRAALHRQALGLVLQRPPASPSWRAIRASRPSPSAARTCAISTRSSPI